MFSTRWFRILKALTTRTRFAETRNPRAQHRPLALGARDRARCPEAQHLANGAAQGYESLARWAEQHAIGSIIPLDLLRSELQRRSAKLDESETEDEKRERETLDESIQAEERRNAVSPPITKDQKLLELYDRRGMGRR
jgi:hypothetical protein